LAYTSDDLLKLIHDSKALSIWDRKKGPVLWYILGVPGPFYFNVELMIGKDAAERLLEKITTILAETPDLDKRAEKLNALILPAYESSPAHKQIIAAMAAKLRENTSPGECGFISGGERRDWLFSIPLAKELGLPHVFLFKNQNMYCAQPLKPNAAGLHVADLINNAASYFDMWLPALKKAQLSCPVTECVVSRGIGAGKLEESGVKVLPLVTIDLGFFERSHANGLIDKETLEEIATHFRSPKEWAEKYLIGKTDVFDVAHAEGKSFERMQSFFTKDPWSLRAAHGAFFDTMQAAIAARRKSAA
jgi:orotate phosphoribosyltransferase